MSETSRHEHGQAENVELWLHRHIQLGADQDLMDLFGASRDGESAEIIDSGRQEILARGFLTEADVDGDDSELLTVVDHGVRLYPAFQFEAGTAVPLPGAAYANALLKSGGFSSWEAAFWWVSNTGLLDGRTPLEVPDVNTPEGLAFLRRAVDAEIDESY